MRKVIFSTSRPLLFREFSTSRVLTMSWEDGIDLRTWMRENKNLQQPRRHCTRCSQFVLSRIFSIGALSKQIPTSPIFWFGPIAENKIGLVLLDFGATKEYDRSFISNYTDLLRFVDRKDYKGLVAQAIQFGFLDPRESKETQDLFVELMETAAEPFRASPKKFKFSDEQYGEKKLKTWFVVSARR